MTHAAQKAQLKEWRERDERLTAARKRHGHMTDFIVEKHSDFIRQFAEAFPSATPADLSAALCTLFSRISHDVEWGIIGAVKDYPKDTKAVALPDFGEHWWTGKSPFTIAAYLRAKATDPRDLLADLPTLAHERQRVLRLLRFIETGVP